MSPVTQTKVVWSDEWATPRWLFDHFDAEFHFTLDPACKPWNAKCAETCDYNGLGRSWGGHTVWLNPPYSDIDPWLAKARKAVRLGGATVVALLPCVPDRKWWAAHVEDEASEVRFLTRSLLKTGRVHFEREDGTAARAPFPSCVVVYRGSRA